MKKPVKVASFLAVLALPVSLFAQAPSLTIQVDHPTAKVSPIFYGLMTEEINHSYDGGIYPELVRDRIIGSGFGSLTNWSMVARGDSIVNISQDATVGPSEAIKNSLRVTVTTASASSPAGVENGGYWGIAVRPHSVYTGSLWAKTDVPGLPLTISLQNDQTGVVAASATVDGLTSDWKRYTYTLKTGDVPVSSNNHLILTIAKPATVWLDLVSLFPPTYHDRPNGNRVDLMDKLAAMHPHFCASPGATILRATTLPTALTGRRPSARWVDRPGHRSPWRYRSTDGMGLLEFLEWCEDLHMQPLLAVYAGYSLAQEHVDPGPALEPYVQDALDEIQYVTGGTDTKWGAERAKTAIRHRSIAPRRNRQRG